MASSATDAGNTEKAIREKLIETGDVDVIVSVGNNFFYTLSLPCHLWFLDKGKPKKNRKKILMIDARNTYRVVNSTINDFSDGQLLNLTTIVQLYRGNAKNITFAENEHKSALKAQFKTVNKHYKTLAKDLKKLAKELGNDDLVISEKIAFNGFKNPEQAQEIFNSFEKPAPNVSEFIKGLEAKIAKITEQAEKLALSGVEGKKKIVKKTATEKMKPFKDKLNMLNKPLKTYQNETAEFLKEIKQRVGDWEKLLEWFPEKKYADVEGLCKITDLEEVKENDYSLTPGRYVGYSIQIDKDFDYRARMKEIHGELAELNTESNDLMEQIQRVVL